MVPNGWEKKQLSEIVKEKISYGIVQAGEHIENGIPYIKSSDIRGFINPETLQKTSPEIHFKYRRSAVHPGDIVFSLRGNIGESAIVPDILPEANLTQGTARISVSEDNCNLFYYYQLASEKILNRINSLSKGSTFKEISLEQLRKVEVLSPPLNEQKKIAEILSTWDKAIEMVKKLVANSQQQKKALMQQLLTGQKRLLDDNGMKFGDEWEEFSVSDLCKIGRGRVISKNEIQDNSGIYPVYSSQTLNNGIMGYLNTFDFDGEYVTWTTDGVNAGTIFYRNGKFNCTNVCGTLSPKSDLINLKFLALALSRVAFKYVSHTLANPKLMNGVMGTITIRIPPIKEQEKIAQVLTLADREIDLYQQQLDKLKLEKKSLMQQLLTGQKRVKLET